MKVSFRWNLPAQAALALLLCVPQHLPAAAVPLPAEATSWWRAEGDATDVLAANSGALLGTTGFSSGRVGQAFVFDGDDNGVTVAHAESLNIGAAGFTVEFWMKGTKNQPNSLFLMIDKSHGLIDQGGWAFQGNSSSGTVRFAIGTGSAFPEAFSTTDVLDDQWHHIAGTWMAGTFRLYIDGTEEGNATAATVAGNNRPVMMGHFWGNGTPTRFFRGQLDEPAIYSRALTATEILKISDAGASGKTPACSPASPNTISSWRGENNAQDGFGSNHGTALNGAGFADGMVGRAFHFDAAQQSAVRIPAPAALDNPTAITLEAWVFPTSFPNGAPSVVRKNMDGTGNPQFLLAVGNGLTPGLPHFNSGVPGAGPTGSTPIPLNAWTHLAGTYDGTTAILYMNGVIVESLSVSGTIPSGTRDLFIGNEDSSTDRAFDGLIDELAIYDSALSNDEILRIFNAGSSGKCGPEPVIEAGSLNYNAGQFAFRITGVPNQTYKVQGAQDYVTWADIEMRTLSTPIWDFTDPNPGNLSFRFYRPVFLPR